MRSTHRPTVGLRRDVPSITFLFLLSCLLTGVPAASVARAAPSEPAKNTLAHGSYDDRTEDPDEYDVKTRVARISLIVGDVSLKREGNDDWERVRLNFPLVEGDTISTENEARAEIQIDARNFVRLGANSILKIVTLRDEGVALSVVEGTATIRLAKFDRRSRVLRI